MSGPKRFRFRQSFNGKMILQVGERKIMGDPTMGAQSTFVWRDAQIDEAYALLDRAKATS